MKLSVLIITYNHEHFIAQAIESVLIQKTNFDYEIVIGEDYSVDRTRDILFDYQKKYPGKIRLVLAEKNRGLMQNFISTFKACAGEYIAVLGGDDYWTSPQKLQTQVDYLNTNRDLSCCFHNVTVVYEDQDMASHLFHLPIPQFEVSTSVPSPVSTLDDIVPANFLQASSVMFRNRLFPSFPDWYAHMPMEDWPLHILNAQHGNIGYIDEVLSAYRVHRSGLWSSNMSRFQKLKDYDELIYCYNTINKHLNFQYNNLICLKLANLYRGAINLSASLQLKSKMLRYLARYLSIVPLKEVKNRKMLFKLLVKTIAPSPFKLLQSKS